MGQSKTMSILESCANITVGMLVAYIAQRIIFPMFGIHVSEAAHVGIVVCFTVVSFVRSYLIRRYFNGVLIGRTKDV